MVRLEEVSKNYPAPGGGQELQVLHGVSLEVKKGESLAIVGPSGSGKSTLLQIIGTLDQPTRGRVQLNNREVTGLDEKSLAEIRSREIGFVFQNHYLLPQCTVLENVLVPTLANPGSGSPNERRAQELLARVGLHDRLNHFPAQLSGGERQRVAVVRAMINQPALLLADEPTGALDHASATALGDLLCQLKSREQVCLIVVTHARELAQRMDRSLTLQDGRLSP